MRWTDNDATACIDEGFEDLDDDAIADCVDDDLDNDGWTNDRDNRPLIRMIHNATPILTERVTDDDDDDGDGFVDTTTAVPSIQLVSRRGEQCNGLDDDRHRDELAEQPCFDGDDALIGVGVCRGTQECLDGEWDCQCGLSTDEVCDGQDQDCDGGTTKACSRLA